MSKSSAVLLIFSIVLIFDQNLHNSSVDSNVISGYKYENLIIHKLFYNNYDFNDTAGNEEEEECTPPAIKNFPYIPIEFRESVYMSLISVVIIVYLFVATALICDEYFVPAIEKICDKLKLEPNIAGCTFMAAGTSAPDLAATLVGVFIAQDDIGVGTVVGSTIFNVPLVIAICALFAGNGVKINWWSMSRDSIFNIICICLLFGAMFDEKIVIYEAIILLIVYGFYILFVGFNKPIEKMYREKFMPMLEQMGIEEFGQPQDRRRSSIVMKTKYAIEIQIIDEPIPITLTTNTHSALNTTTDSNLMHTAKRMWKAAKSPLVLLHWLTVPDCRLESTRSWFAITFLMSCVWISVYSYIIVWMISIIGYNCGIPDAVMGLIFVAGGSSMPDAIIGVIVTRNGLADMALSNALASNIFNILVCLGLPWFLQILVKGAASNIPVISKTLKYSTLSLVLAVIFFMAMSVLNKWRLTKKYGTILLIFYFAFLLISSLVELNVFGQLNLPMCSNY